MFSVVNYVNVLQKAQASHSLYYTYADVDVEAHNNKNLVKNKASKILFAMKNTSVFKAISTVI